ncbi:MAG: hypothetical protein IT385_27230 [Deltaproteobacteria bacterium]|nr:hypothetical protein [Deltaproteobacteria bacterium]
MGRAVLVLTVVTVASACDDNNPASSGTSDARVLACPEGAVELAFARPAAELGPEDLRAAADVRWCDRDGLADGPYREIGADGRTLAEGRFALDRAEDVWTWYHAGTTTKRKQVTFGAGVAQGLAASWFEDGSPRFERHYERGGACGLWKTWAEAGATPVEQHFGACDDGVAWEPRVVRDAPVDVARAWTGACAGDGAALVIGADAGYDEDAAWCEVGGVRAGPYARFWDAARTRQREDGRYEAGDATGTWHTFASTGEVVGRALYHDGAKDGDETLWRVDGSKAEARSWVAGQADGVWEAFYPSGPKASETVWKAGLRDGREVAFALDGTARRETMWRGDVRHGVERLMWDADGAVRAETPYVDGLREGVMTTWHPNGQRADEVNFLDDIPTSSKTWDHDGLPTSEATYDERGLLRGPATIWRRDPVLGLRVKDQGAYVDGRAEGPWIGVYEEAGTRWREHSFHRGVNDGPFTMWWPDGSKQAEGELAWGALEYVYRVWWDNENRALECGYRRGLRDGACTEWWENGQMKARGEYGEGVKREGWEYWDEAGNPTSAPEGEGP